VFGLPRLFESIFRTSRLKMAIRTNRAATPMMMMVAVSTPLPLPDAFEPFPEALVPPECD
jgi:hypothetical protein